MHKTARQAAILKLLTLQGTYPVSGLAQQLGVSDETIRRDIKAMANRGLVEHVHGAVVLPELFREPDFRRRLDHNAEAKRAIARAAAGRVRDGESLMLDTGSTTVYVARALAQHRDLMVVTNCVEIARGLASRNRNRVYLAGGEFRAEDSAVFGAAAQRFVEQFRVRTAILSIAAIDAVDGLMDFHLAEAEFSRAVIRRAERVIVAADGSKFAAQAPVKVCDLKRIDLLVTDVPPPAEAQGHLAEAGVSVVVAEAERAAQKR